MDTREAPGWARPVEDAGEHVVTCPTCGEVMSWAAYLRHGPDCGGESFSRRRDNVRRRTNLDRED